MLSLQVPSEQNHPPPSFFSETHNRTQQQYNCTISITHIYCFAIIKILFLLLRPLHICSITHFVHGSIHIFCASLLIMLSSLLIFVPIQMYLLNKVHRTTKLYTNISDKKLYKKNFVETHG